jgi:hypothetical protein
MLPARDRLGAVRQGRHCEIPSERVRAFRQRARAAPIAAPREQRRVIYSW